MLRPYQLDALAQLRARWRQRPILCLATGAGKTVVAAEIVRGAVERGRRALILAHTRQIVSQTAARFRDHGLAVGVLMADEHPGDAPVIVASVQTLIRREFPAASVVIIDEAHHATSESYRRIIEHYSDAAIIGLTATPQRLDGQGLGEVGFGAIIEPVTYEQLFAEGWLVRPVVYAPTVPDLSGVRRRAGDFDMHEASKRIAGRLVEHYRNLANGSRAVAFACSILHSQSIAEGFEADGVPAEHLDGGDADEIRAGVLARIVSGDTLLVSNCSLFGEGFDLPSLECCIMARPTQSMTVYRQQAGRVMRPAPGKATAIILDHAGNSLRHGFPWSPITWSLDGKARATGDGETPCKRCDDCGCICPSGCSECPECGAPFVFGIALPSETDERLGKLTPETFYASLVALAWDRGWKIGYARHRYRTQFGDWPRHAEIERRLYPCDQHEIGPRWGRRFRCARCLRTYDPEAVGT